VSEQQMPLVYILVLNWNGWQDTLACVESLRRLEYPAARVLVIDNGSTDASLDRLRAACAADGRILVELLALGANHGFAGGMNRGIEHALSRGAAYVFLLNNDTIVAPDILNRLLAVAEARPDAGLIGCELRPWGTDAAPGYALVGFDWLRGVARTWAVPPGGVEAIAVDVISGCAVLVRRLLIERIGLMDERYFLYFEDVDWSVRAQRAGFGCLLVRGAVVWHRGGASTRGSRKQPRWTFYYYHTRNNILFVRTHGSGWARLTSIAFVAGRTLWTALRVVGGGVFAGHTNVIPRLTALWTGFVDGWRGRWGVRSPAAVAESS
jgi:GT2 family glycosyltransferase